MAYGKDELKSDEFHRNRFARAFPVYYVCSAIALPLWFAGFGSVPSYDITAITLSIITTVIPVNTFFIFVLGVPIDGPGWTISTLAVMWLLFPCTYPRIKSMESSSIVRLIADLYWLQLAVLFILFFGLVFILGFWPAFAAATMQPLSRFPLFVMGICAGELCLRQDNALNALWSNCILSMFPPCKCCSIRESLVSSTVPTMQRFASCFFSLLGAFLITFIVDTAVRVQGGGGILGAVWLQAMVPAAQLQIIVHLTSADVIRSDVGAFLGGQVMQFLGKISMCIYLIHWPVIYMLCWAIEGDSLSWPRDWSCPDDSNHDACQNKIDHFNNARTIPMWGIPVVIIISVLLATVLFCVVEEPCRKLLKTNSSRRAGVYIQTTTHSSSGTNNA